MHGEVEMVDAFSKIHKKLLLFRFEFWYSLFWVVSGSILIIEIRPKSSFEKKHRSLSLSL